MRRRSMRVAILATLSLVLALLAGTAGQVALHPQAAQASVSAGDLVFATGQFGDPTTAIAKYSGDTVTDLTATDVANGVSDQDPAVSPDGSRIAYQSLGHSDADEVGEPSLDGLYIMDSDGNNPTQVTSLTEPECDGDCTDTLMPEAWNPAGTKIVFARQYSADDATVYEIDTIDADGSGFTSLISGADNVGAPAWSPDGSKIAYDGPDGDIYVMNADGSDQTDVSGTAGYNPTWSPDGSKIYFDDGNNIFGMNADGTDLVQLTDTSWYGGHDFEPTVSPDGDTIAFSDNGDSIQTISASADMGDNGTTVDAESGDSEPDYVPATWPNDDTKTIVALGDSVAAGEGINYGYSWDSTDGDWVQDGSSTPIWNDTTVAMGDPYQQCHQSSSAYPNLVASSGNYVLYNMACTGASALQNSDEDGGVLDSEQFDSSYMPYPEDGGGSADADNAVPAQLGGDCEGCDSLNTYFNAHNPDIVLLTAGADDVGFRQWVVSCYFGPTACNTDGNTDTLDSELTLQETDLRETLTALNSWATDNDKTLRVLVTNYYDPFSSDYTSCSDIAGGELWFGITPGEMTWLQDGLSDLNSNISQDYSKFHVIAKKKSPRAASNASR